MGQRSGDLDNLMCIGIEFRLKGIAEGETPAFKQLKNDIFELKNQYTEQVFSQFNSDKIEAATNDLFRSFNLEHKGHNIAQ